MVDRNSLCKPISTRDFLKHFINYSTRLCSNDFLQVIAMNINGAFGSGHLFNQAACTVSRRMNGSPGYRYAWNCDYACLAARQKQTNMVTCLPYSSFMVARFALWWRNRCVLRLWKMASFYSYGYFTAQQLWQKGFTMAL
jgi:hypothetical protein